MILTRTRRIPRSTRLHQLQTRCVERLSNKLKRMLDHIDDVFFDLADGGSSEDHNEYFRALRELRLQRDTIESQFRNILADAFLHETHEEPGIRPRPRLTADIAVNVDTMSQRIRSQHPSTLLQVETRLRLLMPEITHTAELPLAPESICQAFMQSLKSVEIAPNPQLVLLKHFEREVLAEFGPLLRDALDILRASRQNTIDTRTRPTAAVKPHPSPTEPQDFLHRLDALQQRVIDTGHNVTPELQAQWRHHIRQCAQTPRQENTVNAVFMLFEYMLDRQELTPPQASAFARLQIPVIIVALQDTHFIRDAGHPMRRLLKTLANITLRHKHAGHDDDRLALALDNAVNAVLHLNNAINEALCRQIENDFLATLSGQATSSPGPLRRRWDSAPVDSGHTHNLITQLLQNRLQGKTIPEDFLGFIEGPWSTWLHYCRDVNGNASPTWQEALNLTDELIWSVQPHHDEDSHERWMKRLPSLVKAVTDVLGQKLPPGERDSAVERLWILHAALLKGDPHLRFITPDFTLTEPDTPIP